MAERETLSVRKAGDTKLREHVDHRYTSMMAGRQDLSADCYEIAGLCLPSRSKPLVEAHKAVNRSASLKSNLYDGHAIRSFEICANGMLSGLSSRSQRWFNPILSDRDLMEFYPVRLWLDEVSKIMYAAFAQSNFYEAALSCYLEMAAFGTAANVMVGHDRIYAVNHALTFGEYAIATGEDQRADSLARTYTLTVRQIVEKFVAERFDSKTMHWDRVTRPIQEAWDRGSYEQAHAIRHILEPNPGYVPGKIGTVGKPYRSIRWEASQADKTKFLSIEGFDEQCFMAPRWETMGGEVWGTGRGKKALPDMRALQLQSKRKGQATDMAVKPPTWGPPSLDAVSMTPGSHTVVAAADMKTGVQTIYNIPWQVLGAVSSDVEDARRSIDRMTYADLFMAISNMDGVQPRNVEELVRRHEEQLTQLGPVTDRANSEFLQIAFDRMFGILSRAGMFPEAPEEIQGHEILVDFSSILSQAQQMMGIGQTERAVGFVGNMVAVFPDAPDNIDSDAIIKDYWRRSGAPATGLRDEAVRDAMREARAQQAQMDKMAEMAPAAEAGANAAATLADLRTTAGAV